MTDQERRAFRMMIRGFYVCQDERIAIGLRLVRSRKAELGMPDKPAKEEKALTPPAKEILSAMKESHTRLTDAVVASKRPATEFRGDAMISTWVEYCLVDEYLRLLAAETIELKHIEAELDRQDGNGCDVYPIWTQWLKPEVKGVGPTLAGVLVAFIDVTKSDTRSGVWKYCGLDVVTWEDKDGRLRSEARRRIAEHRREEEYVDRKGEKAVRSVLTFRPFLQSKLLGVLGECLVRARDYYYGIYLAERHRLDHHVAHRDKSDGHKSSMARRKAVKLFIGDYWKRQRELLGLPVRDEYAREYLGRAPHGQADPVGRIPDREYEDAHDWYAVYSDTYRDEIEAGRAKRKAKRRKAEN